MHYEAFKSSNMKNEFSTVTRAINQLGSTTQQLAEHVNLKMVILSASMFREIHILIHCIFNDRICLVKL